MKISLNLETINQIDLSHLAQFLSWNPNYQNFFLEKAGKEPYKLLAFLSKEVQSDCCDLGTLYGSSALALSFNESINVLTLDTRRHIPETQGVVTIANRPNIKSMIASAQAVLPHIATCKLVYMDFESQNLDELNKVVNELEYYKFKGVLLVNDIYVNESMKAFWSNIPAHLKKIDATSVGHFTGTGIIVYDPESIDVEIN